MKPLWGYSALGIVAFLVFLLLLAPATLVADQIGSRLAGFTVRGVEGRAIAGALSSVRWRDLSINRLTWRWRPLALLEGRLGINLQTEDPEIKLTGNAALGLNRQITLGDLAGRLPLNRVSNLAAAGNLPLEGMVVLDLRNLALDATGRPTAAQGTIRLLNLRVNLGQPLPLGDYELRLDSAGSEGMQGKIKDINAPLVLEGTLSLQPDGRYRFTGQAMVRDPNNQALRQAMSLLGPPGADGRWPLNFSGALPL
ncbi:MAG: type II secretion system protein N [Candidatus Competibacter denitrificans]